MCTMLRNVICWESGKGKGKKAPEPILPAR